MHLEKSMEKDDHVTHYEQVTRSAKRYGIPAMVGYLIDDLVYGRFDIPHSLSGFQLAT